MVTRKTGPVVFVEDLTGRRLEIPFEPTDTIEVLKCKILDGKKDWLAGRIGIQCTYVSAHGIPPDQQRLIFAGRQLGTFLLSMCCGVFFSDPALQPPGLLFGKPLYTAIVHNL